MVTNVIAKTPKHARHTADFEPPSTNSVSEPSTMATSRVGFKPRSGPEYNEIHNNSLSGVVLGNVFITDSVDPRLDPALNI